jgi:hypothetical protein
MQSAAPDPATLIADLQKRWPQLKDADRALAVHKIHESGVSLRALAKAVNRSPTLMRNLNQAAERLPRICFGPERADLAPGS